MEKVSLYIRKILALSLSAGIFFFAGYYGLLTSVFFNIMGVAFALLLFAYLDFKITGDKPRFLFGMAQSDAFLNKKGGFWNLFKWIVNSLGFLYDLLVWVVWGVYLIFSLVVDFLLLVKFVLYWIIYAIIWFVRQLFPPFIFIFKMVLHYIVKWSWWIYQLAFRNIKITLNKNFYFIALWGAVPALFIVFLFYAISQLVGIPELVAVSVVFALVPLVWSYGEISALRYEERENDAYGSVKYAYRNGFDAVKSVLFYLILIVVLLLAEIVLNMVGWIPHFSMSIFGISLNLNMAISLVLVFLAVILTFAASMMPTHILFHQEHENNLGSSLGFLKVVGRRFLRYTVVHIPSVFFGGVLLLIPMLVVLLSYQLTDTIKDEVLDVRIEQLQAQSVSPIVVETYQANKKIESVAFYKSVPLASPQSFSNLSGIGGRIKAVKADIAKSLQDIENERVKAEDEIAGVELQIIAREEENTDPANIEALRLLEEKQVLENNFEVRQNQLKEYVAFQEVDLKEMNQQRVMMPIFYLFIGIFFAVFGGIVLAIFVAYLGNIYYELYLFNEDEEPTYWCATVAEMKAKDANQPLLGFTLLALIGTVVYILAKGNLLL